MESSKASFEFAWFNARASATADTRIERRRVERGLLASLYDGLGRRFEALAIEGPDIARKQLGALGVGPVQRDDLFGLVGGLELTDLSGNAERIERFDRFAQEIGVVDSFVLGRVRDPFSGGTFTLLANELETADGSLTIAARLATGGTKFLLGAALGCLVAVEVDGMVATHGAQKVGVSLAQRYEVSQSDCALNYGYTLDVSALQGTLGEQYDYEAAEGDERARRACNLQVALTLLGYEVGPIDGIVGQQTKGAWVSYRTGLGMHPTRQEGVARVQLAIDFAAQISRLRQFGP